MSAQPAIMQPSPQPAPLFAVLNVRSGTCEGAATEQFIAELVREAGREIRFFQCGEKLGVTTAARQAARLAREQDGVLLAIGGDGTINATARAALEVDRPMAMIPLGTFNYFARTLGIPQDVERATRALLSGQVEPVQVGCANGELFLVNASLGLYPQLLEDREAFTRQVGRSRLTAIVSSLMTVYRCRRQLSFDTDDKGGSVRTPTLFIGNNRVQLERLGIRPAVLEALDKGRLVALAVRPISTLQTFGLLLRGALGRLGEAEQINAFGFRELRVMPRGRRKIKVAVDGEIVRMRTPIVFRVHPKPLSVLLPAPEDRAEIE